MRRYANALYTSAHTPRRRPLHLRPRPSQPPSTPPLTPLATTLRTFSGPSAMASPRSTRRCSACSRYVGSSCPPAPSHSHPSLRAHRRTRTAHRRTRAEPPRDSACPATHAPHARARVRGRSGVRAPPRLLTRSQRARGGAWRRATAAAFVAE
eukprot:3673141-Prymnesium_polylepis.1